MMPALRERAKRFNRISKEDYLSWMSSRTGVVITHVPSRERAHIDAAFEAALAAVPEVVEEQPAWVDAAEEVLAQSEPEPEPELPSDVGLESQPDEPEVIPDQPADNNYEVVEEAPTDSPFDVDIDYDSMTVAELRDVCRDRGLTIRGTKAEVVLRLRRDDEGITEETQPDDETEAPAEAAAEESSDAPAEEAAVTEEVTNNDESSEQEEDINE
jgi:hypothetical protein|tara:strand:- start:4702 stop:5343 length:642 start_codon:yes stop_codon:yes gene_type:complete